MLRISIFVCGKFQRLVVYRMNVILERFRDFIKKLMDMSMKHRWWMLFLDVVLCLISFEITVILHNRYQIRDILPNEALELGMILPELPLATTNEMPVLVTVSLPSEEMVPIRSCPFRDQVTGVSVHTESLRI